MKYILGTVVFLLVFLVPGYFMLKFSSRISGVDMFRAVAWSFKSKEVLLFAGGFMMYMIVFFMLLFLITQPFQSLSIGTTQVGGLEGYIDDDYMYNYFDPFQRSYVQIKVFEPPAVPTKLTETFRVVSFFKPLSHESYRNVVQTSLPVLLIILFFFLISVFPLYHLLRVLANDYAAFTGAAEKVTSSLLAANFRKITGYGMRTVIGAAAVIFALLIMVPATLSGNVLRKNKEIYGRYSGEYRERIVKSLTGLEKISGRVVRRDFGHVTEYMQKDEASGELRDRWTVTHPVKKYTIRITGLVNVPVFVNLELYDDPASPYVRRLDSLFAGEKDTRPSVQQDEEFIVNKDFSIRLSDR